MADYQDLERLWRKVLLFELKIYYGVESFDLKENQVSLEDIYDLIDTLIPIGICQRHTIIPLTKIENQEPCLIVAMANPDCLSAQDEIKWILQNQLPYFQLQRVVILEEDYMEIIHSYLDLKEAIRKEEQRQKNLELEESNLEPFEYMVVQLDDRGSFSEECWGQGKRHQEKLAENICLEMVLIPDGKFMMGASQQEAESHERERPIHWVWVEKFLMGRFPVTQEQWRAVAEWKPVNIRLDPEPSAIPGDNHPVENISFEEALEFCDRLTLRTKHLYRLPSEAEWEYACRAGTTTPFHFGETISTDVANYCGKDNKVGKKLHRGCYKNGFGGKYRATTTPVNYFGIANAFGLSDMHGNVWEWCADHWHNNYEDAPSNARPWFWVSGEQSRRVLRGGSWCNGPRLCRSAYRLLNSPNHKRDSYMGFRVACSISNLF